MVSAAPYQATPFRSTHVLRIGLFLAHVARVLLMICFCVDRKGGLTTILSHATWEVGAVFKYSGLRGGKGGWPETGKTLAFNMLKYELALFLGHDIVV